MGGEGEIGDYEEGVMATDFFGRTRTSRMPQGGSRSLPSFLRFESSLDSILGLSSRLESDSHEFSHKPPSASSFFTRKPHSKKFQPNLLIRQKPDFTPKTPSTPQGSKQQQIATSPLATTFRRERTSKNRTSSPFAAELTAAFRLSAS
ncbi:hypothetical protein MA16_Dca027320 [Dendrobium catenatum]|uniref:Uncharacterized protein n=1 Tax=Dendrobium catenatum TaxID=906689 RepID=A0A2I0X9Y5_9ASPA|nr:hypothetical protein MA16_Dca027320 [Dendrobium catenatum]